MTDHASLVPPMDAAPSAGSEEVIFQGPVSLRVAWTSFFGCFGGIFTGLVVLLYGFFFAPEGLIKYLAVVAGGAGLAASCMMVLYIFIQLRLTKYKITSRMIERERGLMVKRVDSFALARVKDLQLQQSLFERLLRIGTIRVISSDATEPDLLLEGLEQPREIYTKMRDAVMTFTEKRGVVPLS